MLPQESRRARVLYAAGAFVVALLVGAWTLPLDGAVEESGTLPMASLSTDSPAAVNDGAFTVFANIPLNEIQDGQFCQAYANVYNGTPPYTFVWSGQFTNADAESGPLGQDQIVNGYINSFLGNLTLEVWDSADNYDTHTAVLNIHWSYDFNGDCLA